MTEQPTDPELERLLNEEDELVRSGRAERRVAVNDTFGNPMECPSCEVVEPVRREDQVHCGRCGTLLMREVCPGCEGPLEWREPPPEERRELCPTCRSF